MPIFKLNRRALSFQAMTNRLPAMTDPLEFLNSVGSTIPVRDAYQQIHGAIHASLSDVERSVQAVFERLGPESTITERMIQDANDDIRTDLALASTFAGAKRDRADPGDSCPGGAALHPTADHIFRPGTAGAALERLGRQGYSP